MLWWSVGLGQGSGGGAGSRWAELVDEDEARRERWRYINRLTRRYVRELTTSKPNKTNDLPKSTHHPAGRQCPDRPDRLLLAYSARRQLPPGENSEC